MIYQLNKKAVRHRNGRNKMKNIKIVKLWKTGIEILSFDEFQRPTSFSDLVGCEGVEAMDKKGKSRLYIIDGKLCQIDEIKVEHPTGFGKIYCLSVTQ